MKRRQLLKGVGAAALVHAQPVRAETYPSKPITLIVPYPTGGGGDAGGRALADQLKDVLGVSVVVENVAGAGASIGTMKAVRSAPDGYTLLVHNNGLANTPVLYPQLKLDVERDLAPVGIAATGPMTLTARMERPEKTAKEVFESIRARGEKINFGTAGPGTISHLCALLLMDRLRTKFSLIPYKGTGPALIDLMAGQIDFMLDQVPAVQYQGGRVKPYAVTSESRTSSLPGTPTFAESGVPNYRVEVWQALYTPSGTPPERIQVVSKALAAAIQKPAFINGLRDRGVEPASPQRATPAGHAAMLREEIELWKPILQRAGVTGT